MKMRACLVISILLCLSACADRQEAQQPNVQEASPETGSAAVGGPAAPGNTQNQRPAPLNPPRTGKLVTRLHLPPQPEPVYQAKSLPKRPAPAPAAVTPGQATPATSPKPAAPPRAPNPTSGLFAGGRTPASNTASAPAAPPPAPAPVARRSASPATAQQSLSFADCARQLQGAVKGRQGARLVQNDAAGYVVEMNTPAGVQRVSCDPRTNTVAFSQR